METKLSDLIYLERDFLSKEDCQQYIEYYENNHKRSGNEVSTNINTGNFEKATFSVIEIEKASKVHLKVREQMRKGLINYFKHLDSLGLYSILMPKRFQYAHQFRILKYDLGQKIHAHSDHTSYTYGSIVLNLTEDYEGGEFSFFNGKVTYNLKQGDLMIFPANDFFIHEVEKVKSGIRYSINSFITSTPDEVYKLSHNSTNKLEREYLEKTHPDKINGPFFPQSLPFNK